MAGWSYAVQERKEACIMGMDIWVGGGGDVDKGVCCQALAGVPSRTRWCRSLTGSGKVGKIKSEAQPGERRDCGEGAEETVLNLQKGGRRDGDCGMRSLGLQRGRADGVGIHNRLLWRNRWLQSQLGG